MERDSAIYKIRRKAQVLAYHVLPHEFLSKIYCRICLRENVNIKNPKTFNEKLQWLKLYYNPYNPLVVQCTDKYEVREFIEKKGYGESLTHLLGVWDKAEDIDWDTLPNKFVLKCTHGCAYNILCKDKGRFDRSAAVKQLNKWLEEDFSAFNVELHYGKIKHRRIICEEYLGDVITDYKFFCFNGSPEFFYVSSDLIHDRQSKIGFFYMDGSKMPLVRNDYEDIGDIELPECLPNMIEAAKKMAWDFPFVRVDFFLVENSYKFAELTFTPGACMMPLNPKEFDMKWGSMLKLPNEGSREHTVNDFGSKYE